MIFSKKILSVCATFQSVAENQNIVYIRLSGNTAVPKMVSMTQYCFIHTLLIGPIVSDNFAPHPYVLLRILKYFPFFLLELDCCSDAESGDWGRRDQCPRPAGDDK